MKKIGIFYGSSVGNTRVVAEKLHDLLPDSDLYLIEKTKKSDIEKYNYIIFGTSTWGSGNLQDDFENFSETLKFVNLKNKQVALFGLGDQYTYPDTFCNGMGKLYEIIKDKGCIFKGQWPIDEYDFSDSVAIEGGMFVGLALDEDNEPDLSVHRLKEWIKTLDI